MLACMPQCYKFIPAARSNLNDSLSSPLGIISSPSSVKHRWQISVAEAKSMVNVPTDDNHSLVLYSNGMSLSAGKFAVNGELPVHAGHVFIFDQTCLHRIAEGVHTLARRVYSEMHR